MRLVDVIEHVSHKVSYFYCATTIMRRVATKAKQVASSHEVKNTLLDTNPREYNNPEEISIP